MNVENDWRERSPEMVYEAYPDHDLLPIEPPKPGEKIGEFKVRAEDADDEIDAHEYVTRLDRAIGDIQGVRDAFRESPDPGSSESGTEKRDVTIRLSLGADWIELSLTYADARGRRSGNVTSSLHTPEKHDEEFNAAVDAVESMVLAHACAGIDVTDLRYVEGVRTCIDACANNLPGGDGQ